MVVFISSLCIGGDENPSQVKSHGKNFMSIRVRGRFKELMRSKRQLYFLMWSMKISNHESVSVFSAGFLMGLTVGNKITSRIQD